MSTIAHSPATVLLFRHVCVGGQELLTVGLMARRSGLAVKALRHYDRTGLLRPAAVDGATGYRLYRGDQVAEARLVRLLRSLDLPLGQVRVAVAAWKDERS